MKKVLVLIITVAMAACTFAGCFGAEKEVVKANPEGEIATIVDSYLYAVYEGDAEALRYVEDGSAVAELTNNALSNKVELKQYLKEYISAPESVAEDVDGLIADIVEDFYFTENYIVDEILLEDENNATVGVFLYSPDMAKIEEVLSSIKADDLINENEDIKEKIDKEEKSDEIAFELVMLMLDKAFGGEYDLRKGENAQIKLEKVDKKWVITDIIEIAEE